MTRGARVIVRRGVAGRDAMTDAFARQSADPASEVDTAGDPVAATAATSAYPEACQDDLQRLLTAAR